LVLKNGDLSNTDKLGQVMMNLLAFAITAYMVTAIMGAAIAVGVGLGGLLAVSAGIVISIAIAFTLATAATLINGLYFSFRNDMLPSRKRKFEYA
jgi:hypothetical protein